YPPSGFEQAFCITIAFCSAVILGALPYGKENYTNRNYRSSAGRADYNESFFKDGEQVCNSFKNHTFKF
ncbi:MAG TPA: hypothetical protein VHO90_08285, partial [Bacteroidales bacterium]|nr:hypothetical protein [Bacteroidales bacterium]